MKLQQLKSNVTLAGVDYLFSYETLVAGFDLSCVKPEKRLSQMFKLMLRYNNEGEFVDSVYSPCEYQRAVSLLRHYRKMLGNTHSYILVEV